MHQFVSPRRFCAYVETRGYKTMPLTNTIAAAEGAPLEVVGYQLIGPRGNRKVVGKTREGLLPLLDAELWCDGVDYATSRLKKNARIGG